MTYYLDNFRGFQDTYVDLKNVNFLVGENSSGKTSLINALTIMSDIGFDLNGVIPFEKIDFKSFEDFHSVNSSKEYFSLGLIDDNGNTHLYSFKNDDGLPFLFREILYAQNDEVFVMELIDKRLQYQFLDSRILKNTHRHELELLEYFDSYTKKTMKTLKTDFEILHNSEIDFDMAKDMIEDCEKNKTNFFQMFRPAFKPNGLRYRQVASLAPIRARPESIYTGGKKPFSAGGEHIPFMLKEMLTEKNGARELVQMLNDYGKESGLFDSFNVKPYSEEKTAPFELLVKRASNNYKISSVGYGISQILPVITEMLKSSNEIFTVQQPEVHLHPKAQAAFGAFLYGIASQKFREAQYIIETHSDYILDRFRYQMKESDIKVHAQVLFFKNDGKHNTITTIDIQNDGKYAADNLEDFRVFFIDESFKVMEI
jgi:AAA15 family ATPase/GTPase